MNEVPEEPRQLVDKELRRRIAAIFSTSRHGVKNSYQRFRRTRLGKRPVFVIVIAYALIFGLSLWSSKYALQKIEESLPVRQIEDVRVSVPGLGKTQGKLASLCPQSYTYGHEDNVV